MFEKAKPIWLKNKRTTKNLQVGFRCDFEADKGKTYLLRLTGSTYYRVFLNGKFAGYGPARAGHGYLRCDEIPLEVNDGLNKLAIEVAGYNCSSFYTLPIKSFLCAEILENDKTIKYTGKDFSALSLENLRNIYSYRYSYQRAYTEVWNFDNDNLLTFWQTADDLDFEKTFEFDVCEKFIPRSLPNPCYNIINTLSVEENGNIIHKPYEFVENSRYISRLSNKFEGYLKEDITDKTFVDFYGDFVPSKEPVQMCESVHIGNDEYIIYKLECNKTGFLINNIKALADSSVYVFFSEYNFGNGMILDTVYNQIKIVKYNLKASDKIYELESFEPYTCQYIGIAVIGGEIVTEPPKMREYCYPESDNSEFTTDNEAINKVFDAAKETFRQNTLDIYMDCPGRERGGWLCDSYFTAEAEKFFTGKSAVEDAFLNNFAMAEEFPNIPQGMLPMVYPSDINDYNDGYIPQWAMWYVVELEEYSKKRANIDVEKYRDLCYDLLEWFEKYENNDGFLENIAGWNVIEWSQANDWLQDVSYPTNMLYSKMLSAMGWLFHDESLVKKSDELKFKIIEQSFDGELFIDNAERGSDGVLRTTTNHSEICQYYAYFSDIVDVNDERFEKLSNMIANFGPERKKTGLIPEIAFADAFIGNYLRLVVLLKLKQFDKIIYDVQSYFYKMANLTGTFWEADDFEKAKLGWSLNHGFTSFVGVAAAYAASGISSIDYNNKTIDIDADYLSGINYSLKIATDDGDVIVSENNGTKLVNVPENWKYNK